MMMYAAFIRLFILSVIQFSNSVIGLNPSIVKLTGQITHYGGISSAILTCKVAGVPSTAVVQMSKISLDGEVIIQEDGVKYFVIGGNSVVMLIIKYFTSADAGWYRCTIRDDNLDQQQWPYKQVTVNYEEPRSIIRDDKWNQKFELVQGEEFKFYCNTSGVPKPKVWWEKNRNEEFKMEGPLLHFPSISKEDAGTYYCVADNGIGTPARRSMEIWSVFYPPEVTPENITVVSERGWNVFAVMRLEVRSLPAANVTWGRKTQDGLVPITEDGVKYQIFNFPKREGIFEGYYDKASIAVMVTDASDAGTYVAVAENRLGATTIEFTLTVE